MFSDQLPVFAPNIRSGHESTLLHLTLTEPFSVMKMSLNMFLDVLKSLESALFKILFFEGS